MNSPCLLTVLSNETRVVGTAGLQTVALYLPPVAWFISLRYHNARHMGVYEGEDNRFVGTDQIPLAELTPLYVRKRVEKAITEQIRSALDPEAMREVFGAPDRGLLRDIDQDAPPSK